MGPQELVVIGLLFLVVFGPDKLPSMARDLGHLMTESRRYVDEIKSELASQEKNEKVEGARRNAEKVKNEQLVHHRRGNTPL
jgi:Tat protein translocase TatB subunit